MNLTEDDVPGAKLKFNIIKDNTVADLKRWLACRSLPISGRKIELIERVESCISNGKEHLIFIGIDNGVWWQKKYEKTQSSIPVPPTPSLNLPSTGWKSFPSVSVPRSFCYGVIQEFISFSDINNNGPESSDSGGELIPVCGNSKCIQRGRISFKSGHVQNLEDNNKASLYYLRAKVLSSYKSTVVYTVYITLNSDSKIVDSGCQCKASESKSCSHIIGLLFALEDYTLQFGFDPPTCTSKLKEWNKGRKRGNNPQNIFDADYSRHTGGVKRKSVVLFDPTLSSKYTADQKQIATDFLVDVQSLNKDSMWDFLLDIHYPDYDLSINEQMLLVTKVDALLSKLTPNIAGPFEIAVQQNSQAWLNERRVRITASECKTFFTAKDLTNSIRKKLWSGDVDIINLPQIAYGRTHEDDAFQQYAFTSKLSVKKSGFFINRKLPGLGCSPDGLIISEVGKIDGLLEIKCSPKLEFCSPYDLQKVEKPERMFYTLTPNGIRVKRNHAYYYQVQLSLAILEIEYCDFVVWSKTHPFAVERIYKDDSFIESLKKKLLIAEKNICVEFFEMRLPRQLSLLSIYKST